MTETKRTAAEQALHNSEATTILRLYHRMTASRKATERKATEGGAR